MAIAEFEIGLTEVGLANVEGLTPKLLHPRATPPLPSMSIPLASAKVRGAGWLTFNWTWDFLEQEQYNLLRTYCPARSATIFVSTKDEEGTYASYRTEMIWPERPERSQNTYLDFTITFNVLEEL
jgi:hypothetical protein